MKPLIQELSLPLVYVITDRRLLSRHGRIPELTLLTDFARDAVAAGVDFLQIREPDLPTRELLAVTHSAAELASKSRTRVLVNDRSDIAASVGSGVHLTTRSMSADVVRRTIGSDTIIGVSTHTIEEARDAEHAGADFIVFGPVFETASKKQYGAPVGLKALERVATDLLIPVIALGGITPDNFCDAFDAGAEGVAGISMFARSPDLNSLVATIKGYSFGR